MKKWMLTVPALFLTALLAWGLFHQRNGNAGGAAPDSLRITRVWVCEKEPALSAWLKSCAAAYEKEAGARIYLRSAQGSDLQALGQSNAPPPDLILSAQGGQPAALLGFALIVRDEAALLITPQPTGALFFRPSPSPGPVASPVPWPDDSLLSAVLCPETLMGRVPGAVLSAQPAADFSAGKAKAALLSAGQAAQLQLGFRSYALPDGQGLISVDAEANTDQGKAFLRFLLSDDSQRALQRFGLYSPFLRLYAADDPIRSLIDENRSLLPKPS